MHDYTSVPSGCLEAVIENGEVLSNILPGGVSSQSRNVNMVITFLSLKTSQYLKLNLVQEVEKYLHITIHLVDFIQMLASKSNEHGSIQVRQFQDHVTLIHFLVGTICSMFNYTTFQSGIYLTIEV